MCKNMKQCGAEYINKPTTYYSQIYETMCKSMKQCGAEYINKPIAYYSQIYETMCKKHEANLLPTRSLEALCNVTNLFSFPFNCASSIALIKNNNFR